MIRHSVIFTLRPSVTAAEKQRFFDASARLVEIPGVMQFAILRQVSPKNNFGYSISMEFADKAQYEAYNQHPAHQAFVEQFWMACVEDFLEIDLEPVS